MEVDPSPACFNDDFILDLSKRENREETKDCECLTDKAWTINSCTPLNNFSYADNDLKSYGSEITKLIRKECHIKSAKCEFEVVPELAFTNKDNASVKITVYSTVNGRRKNLFLGYLVSRDSSVKPSHLTRLPIFLYNGSLKVAPVVCAAIQFLFGASMSEVKFSVTELFAFSLIYVLKANHQDDEQDSDFTLKYILPQNFPDNTNIDYSIDPQNLKDLFKRMNERSRDETSITSSFYSDVLLHSYNNFEINLDFLNLSTVSMGSNFRIARKGKIKCRNSSVLNTMLKYLTLIINQVHQV